MIARQARRFPLTAVAITTALAACAETTSVPPSLPLRSEISMVGRFDPRSVLLDPGAPGLIVICSGGGPASFTVTASPNRGTLAGGGAFSVDTDQCVNAWTTIPGDLTDVTVVVTQTAGDFSSIEATATPSVGLPRMTIDAANQRVTWSANADHGGSATFFQQAPPPLESKKLVVCKEGPVGVYTFTVASDAPSGDVFPNGQEFTLSPGECKVAWEQDGPPVDPFVTVTEIGDAPLDSIRKELQDSATVIITDSRTVVSRVGFFHGGVLTFFNAFVDEPPPTGFCSYTPGGWGAPPSGNNVASILAANFATIYTTDLTIGISGVPGFFSMKFTSASAVTNYLPDGGKPTALKQNYVNPTSTASGTLGSQVLALQLNVDFSSAGAIAPGLGDRTVTTGALTGLTVNEVLALANAALGGNTAVLAPYGITVKDLTDILSSVNESYTDCSSGTGYLR